MLNDFKIKKYFITTLCLVFCSLASFAQDLSDATIHFDVPAATSYLKKLGISDQNRINREIGMMRELSQRQYIQMNNKNASLDKITSRKNSNVSKASSLQAADIPQTEKDALQLLYTATDGDHWTRKTEWDFSTPVISWDPIYGTGWYGITVTDGHVTSIVLNGNNLTNTFPNLTALTSLETLEIYGNKLTSPILNIQYLTSLKKLSYGNNQASDNLSPLIPLVNLEVLYVDGLTVSGQIPDEIYNFTNLRELRISNTNVTGGISPRITELVKLESISFGSSRKLGGSIPTQIGNLTSLKYFDIGSTGMTGPIPASFGNLSNLETAYISWNSLEGEIPSSIGNLNKLKTLWGQFNQLTGNLPASVGNMSQLGQLILGPNRLTGTLPASLGLLSNANFLDFEYNDLSGSVPDLTNLTKLSGLRLNNNNFTFADFAEQYPTYKSHISLFEYAPQSETDVSSTITGSVTGSVTLKMHEDGRFTPNETYQWYKGYPGNSVIIPQATSREFTISNLDNSHAGNYYCISTNPIITNPADLKQNLILTRRLITLQLKNCPTINYGSIQTSENKDQVPANSASVITFASSGNSIANFGFKWDLLNSNDESIATGNQTSFTIVPPTIGNYKINLQLTDPDGCTSQYVRNIESIDKCIYSQDANSFHIYGENYSLSDDVSFLTIGESTVLSPNFAAGTTADKFTYSWKLYDPNGTEISSASNPAFPLTLTVPGYYKISLDATSIVDGCVTKGTKTIVSLVPNGCATTNEKSAEVKNLYVNFLKKLIVRAVLGETDAQINARIATPEFMALKPYLKSSTGDKIYNFVSTRGDENRVTGLNLSFSPERPYDIHIYNKSGVYYDPRYNSIEDLNNSAESLIYTDISQYVSEEAYFMSCSVDNFNKKKSSAKTKAAVTPSECTIESEVRNITFCPAEGNVCSPVIAGAIKSGSTYIYSNQQTSFSFETVDPNLTYTWQIITDAGEIVYNSNSNATATFNYTFTEEGDYKIKLIAENLTGCIKHFIKDISVNDKRCINQPNNFSFETTVPNVSYQWDTTDAAGNIVNSVTNATGSYSFTTSIPGKYEVKLTTNAGEGCETAYTKTIFVENCSTEVSCTQSSLFTPKVYGLFMNLINKLLNADGNDANSYARTELTALAPYTPFLKNRIYNFNETDNSISFSFVENSTSSDVYLPKSNSGDITGIELNSYFGMQEKTIVATNFSDGSKNPLDGFVKNINFCPAACEVIEGTIKPATGNLFVNTNNSFSFETTSTNLLYKWTFYDLKTSSYTIFTTAAVNYAYIAPGSYNITLEIKDSKGCTTNFNKTVTVSEQLPCVTLAGTILPAANIVETGVNTTFSLQTAGTGLTYRWLFSKADGSLDFFNFNSTVEKSYTEPGFYNVALAVTDANNCVTNFRKTIEVKLACPTVTGTIKTASQNIFAQYTSTFSFDTAATNLTYEWTFYRNDGSSPAVYNTSTVYHFYSTAGTYNIKLVVKTPDGCSTTINKTVTVTVQPPCVDIVGEIKGPEGPLLTGANYTFSFETAATNFTYQWTMYGLNGVIATPTTSTATQSYLDAGDYQVVLITTDQNDCKTFFIKRIKILKACTSITGAITIPTESITTNQDVPFTFSTTATNLSYKWTFYNKDNTVRSTETTSTVNKSYTSPGTYRINLEITGPDGCKAYFDKTVTITGNCAINGNLVASTENPVLFTYSYFSFETDATNLKYRWEFYDPNNNFVGWDDIQSPTFYFQGESGNYTVKLTVSDSNGCSINREIIVNAQYDCSRNSITGTLYNSTHSNYYSTQVLINKPNKFTFWPYNIWDLSGMTLNWELTNLDNTPVTSFTGQEFIFTPTTSDNLKLKLTITDRNGCPHNFETELQVTEACEYSGEYLSGSIAFENEDNAEVSTIQINQAKELGFRPDREITRSYTYKWEIYNAIDELVDSGNQEKHLLTLTTAGFYRVNVAIENAAGCILNFTKPVNCLIQNSCTNENPKSEIVKNIYLNVLKNLIARSLTKETDEHINASRATDEFEALKPYITNGTKDKIYNYTTVRNEQGRLISVRFSFSPERDYDVQILMKKGLWNYDSDYDGTFLQFSANIASEIYMDLSQYSSSGEYLISCYVQNAQQSSVPDPENPPTFQRAQKTKKLSKISLNTNDCYKESEIRYIDFCPAEACKPTIGVIQSGFSLEYPSSPVGKNSKKPGSKL